MRLEEPSIYIAIRDHSNHIYMYITCSEICLF